MLYRRLPKHRRPSSELPEVTHRVYLDIRECCLSPFACVLFVCLIVVGPPLTRHIVPLSHIPRVRHILLIVLAKTKYDGWRVRIIYGPAIRSIIEISPPHTSRTNTVIADEDEPIRGRIALGLFGNIAPRTVENFRSLCACDGGDGKVSGRPLCYAGTKFHRIGEWYGGGWVGGYWLCCIAGPGGCRRRPRRRRRRRPRVRFFGSAAAVVVVVRFIWPPCCLSATSFTGPLSLSLSLSLSP